MKDLYRVAIIGTGRMGGLIEDELTVNQFPALMATSVPTPLLSRPRWWLSPIVGRND